MPEQLTKHPEVTLQVLRSAGAQCAQGAAQDILTRCPADRFCKLPGGELCVFGLSDASRMTQVSAEEWKAKESEWLPSPADFAFVASLMGPVLEPGKFAGWIAPPAMGINKNPVDFEYVRFG